MHGPLSSSRCHPKQSPRPRQPIPQTDGRIPKPPEITPQIARNQGRTARNIAESGPNSSVIQRANLPGYLKPFVKVTKDVPLCFQAHASTSRSADLRVSDACKYNERNNLQRGIGGNFFHRCVLAASAPVPCMKSPENFKIKSGGTRPDSTLGFFRASFRFLSARSFVP